MPRQSANAAKRLLRLHPVVVWWSARVEVRSALERLRRVAALSPGAYDASRRGLDALLPTWREIQPAEPLRELAALQLERFDLRASDALHLAAALIWSGQKPRKRLFVCNDVRLGDAARRAGFTWQAV